MKILSKLGALTVLPYLFLLQFLLEKTFAKRFPYFLIPVYTVNMYFEGIHIILKLAHASIVVVLIGSKPLSPLPALPPLSAIFSSRCVAGKRLPILACRGGGDGAK